MLTQERLKHLLWYTPSTGELYWKNPMGGVKVGDRAGSKNSLGYLIIMIGGKKYLAHRIVWLFCFGYLPENDLDHINRNRSDNRLANLREVSRSCNVRNTGNKSNNTSGVKGVYKYKGNRWRARIGVNGKNVYLGTPKDFVEAVAHRLAAEQCLGWEGCDSNSPAYQYMQSVI